MQNKKRAAALRSKHTRFCDIEIMPYPAVIFLNTAALHIFMKGQFPYGKELFHEWFHLSECMQPSARSSCLFPSNHLQPEPYDTIERPGTVHGPKACLLLLCLPIDRKGQVLKHH